jgi:allophanate hydrolase
MTDLSAPQSSAGKTTVPVAVVGAHLRGQPLNQQLLDLGARFVEQTQTAPHYRLFALANTSPAKPGMIRSEIGASIEIEIWELETVAFGTLVASVPPPLVIGNVRLASGKWVKGFLCEDVGVQGAEEITSFGGWRGYLASR